MKDKFTIWLRRLLLLCIGMAIGAGVSSAYRHNAQAVIAWGAALACSCGWYMETYLKRRED